MDLSGTPRWLAALLLALLLALGIPSPLAKAQGVSTYDITLHKLGYHDTQLMGPMSTAQFDFSLPSGWRPTDGSYAELYMDYAVNAQGDQFGMALLDLRLNGNLLRTVQVPQQGPTVLRVSLPAAYLLTAESRAINDLRLALRVNDVCERALLASLTVRSTSRFHFAYVLGTPPLDLALYPKPLYQPQSFEPPSARFVLPDSVGGTELTAATMIASRLGRLSYGEMAISSTLASELSPGTVLEEHAIIIAKPDQRSLFAQLALPAPLVERRLLLSSQMPAVVKAGDIVSYTLEVENNSSAAQALEVRDLLPFGAELQRCVALWGVCARDTPGAVRWSIGRLEPGGAVSSTVTVRLDGSFPSGTPVEHTASLVDDRSAILNVDTLSAEVGSATSDQMTETPTQKPPYFFAHGGQAVPEGDGLVQMTLSPWSPQHVAIVVTGLGDAALLRGALALSTAARNPGMSGAFAIVEAARPIPDPVAVPLEDLSFASLGCDSRTLRGLHSESYWLYFDIAPGSQLSADASLALHISHGMVPGSTEVLKESSTIEVSLNGIAIGNAVLDESNASGAWLTFPLPVVGLQDQTNSVAIRIGIDREDVCRFIASDRYWLTVYSDSYVHLPRQPAIWALPRLDDLPAPFASDPNLDDLLFLLPKQPALAEIEGTIRLGYQMGTAAVGQDLWPQVVLGEPVGVDSWPGKQVIAVGLPTENPYIASANDHLPQPFLPGTNEINQEIDHVVFRLPPDVSLGYVQELISPWDKERAMLAATGTTPEGVAWALRSLIDGNLNWQLSGNLALVRDRQVWSMDTRLTDPEVVAAIAQLAQPTPTAAATPTVVPTATLATTPALTATAVAAATAVQTPTPGIVPTLTAAASETGPIAPGSGRPVWLIPLLIVSTLALAIVLVAIIWRNRF